MSEKPSKRKSSKKYMDLREFRESGLLHELNRRFLHPLGLALEILIEKDGSEKLGGIWDFRDFPDGLVFAKVNSKKVKAVKSMETQRMKARIDALGYWIQPDETGNS